jgi:hypothetical protein
VLQATISIPQMLSEAGDDARVYPWFAFFSAGVHSLASPSPVNVYVEPAFSRDDYPAEVSPGIPVWIPPVGTHTVELDDGGAGTAMAGVFVVLFRQHETPDDAIAAGYKVFADTVNSQLNHFVTEHPSTGPTADQVAAMTSAIHEAVKGAIESTLSWYDFFLPQDESIGSAYAVFFGGPGQPDPISTLGRRVLGLDPVGSFTFPTSAIDVEIPVVDRCAAQEKTLNDALAALKQVDADIAQLQRELATGTLAEKAVAREELPGIRAHELPAAKQAVGAAQAALARCRGAGDAGDPAELQPPPGGRPGPVKRPWSP